MRRASGVAIAIAVGTVAVVAPIWISIQLAWNEALADRKATVQDYANDIVLRGETAATQLNDAFSLLTAAHYEPCSTQEIALMQELDVTSNYIQGISRISGNQLTCSSLATNGPIDLGPVNLVTENNVEERFNVWMFRAQTHPLLVVSKNGFAFIIDSALVEELSAGEAGIAVGIFVPSKQDHNLISSRNGNIDQSWLRTIPKGTSTTFIQGGYIVSVARAQSADIAAVAACPTVYVRKKLQPFTYVFIPLGLICAAGLAWAVTVISRSRLSLPAALRGAAKRKEFFVLYQPIADLKTGHWVGAEALVRWRTGGIDIMPDEFIPLAEESGVITYITESVAEIVAADLPSLLKIDPQFHISLNLSAPDLVSTRTIDLLNFVMTTGRAKPSNLHVEATERHFLQGEESRRMISLIRSMGISISIDDFGTGYSSLSCVQDLHLDALKIDKSFVDTIGTDGVTSQVVPHIIDMAHSLRLAMIAEGVETEAQAEFLRRQGVHYAQGWLFGHPMSINALRTGLELKLMAKDREVLA
jgi:sensor c-di-GMP phosphodiesterase-like protein